MPVFKGPGGSAQSFCCEGGLGICGAQGRLWGGPALRPGSSGLSDFLYLGFLLCPQAVVSLPCALWGVTWLRGDWVVRASPDGGERAAGRHVPWGHLHTLPLGSGAQSYSSIRSPPPPSRAALAPTSSLCHHSGTCTMSPCTHNRPSPTRSCLRRTKRYWPARLRAASLGREALCVLAGQGDLAVCGFGSCGPWGPPAQHTPSQGERFWLGVQASVPTSPTARAVRVGALQPLRQRRDLRLDVHRPAVPHGG